MFREFDLIWINRGIQYFGQFLVERNVYFKWIIDFNSYRIIRNSEYSPSPALNKVHWCIWHSKQIILCFETKKTHLIKISSTSRVYVANRTRVKKKKSTHKLKSLCRGESNVGRHFVVHTSQSPDIIYAVFVGFVIPTDRQTSK